MVSMRGESVAESSTVMLVGADNKAVQRTVVANRTVGDKWLVSQGLAPGDKVIVEGLDRLKPGQTYAAVAKRPHLVTNAGKTSLTFLVLQGMGEYDYVPLV